MQYSKLATEESENHELDSHTYGRSVRIALPGAAGELTSSRWGGFCSPLTTLSKPALALFALLSLLVLLTPFALHRPPSYPPSPDHCIPCGPHDDICQKWGSSVLTRSRTYTGSGAQLDPFFAKVRAGRKVKIGIIGGSISACIDSTLEDCYATRLEAQLGMDFRDFGTEVKVFDGAISAVGSDFFASCWSTRFLEEVDLMIVELAVNDVWEGKENRNMDALLRSLLERPSKPGLLLFNMWSPLHPWSNGAASIDNLAQYYDIPVISHRNVVYHHRQLHRKPDEIHKWFSPGAEGHWQGGHHPAKLGHELSSDLLVSFFRERLCRPPHVVSGRMGLDLPSHFSAWSPFQGLDEDPHPSHAASVCYGPQPGELHFPFSRSPSPAVHGFALAHWKAKNFLAAHEVGDRVEFDVEVRQGWVAIMYWRSSTLNLGRARAWLEGEEDRFEWLWGDWGESSNVPVRHDIRTDWPSGKRKFIVEIDPSSHVEGQHEFRISAIIT